MTHDDALEEMEGEGLSDDLCVVSLKKAEQQGVPLPTGWGPKVAALLDGSLQTKGALRL